MLASRVLAFTSSHFGFMRQGFGSRAAGVAPERRHQNLHPCQTEPVPASSKIGPLLAKAEPMSASGSVSGVTWFRNTAHQLLRERSKNM